MDIPSRVLDPVSLSLLIKDRAAYDSDKDVPDHITRPAGFVGRVPSVGSEVDWVEPSLNLCNSRLSQPCGSNKVYDAFHLLQTEPSVQVSLLFKFSISILSEIQNTIKYIFSLRNLIVF